MTERKTALRKRARKTVTEIVEGRNIEGSERKNQPPLKEFVEPTLCGGARGGDE